MASEESRPSIDETEVLEMLHSLKVISTIREHDKILTKRGLFVDHTEAYLQSFTRWMQSENRHQNIETIAAIFSKTFTICFELISTKKDISEGSTDFLRHTQLLNRLKTEIKHARKGLGNLTVTYQDDTHTVAKIMLIQDRIEDKLQQLQHHLQD